MADALFQRTQLASLADEKPVRLTIDGLDDDALWLTSLRGEVKPNFQLMYAIDGGKFINTFRQRLSLWPIQGVYALADCGGPIDAVGEPPFLRFYNKHNISRAATNVRITFSGIVIIGYLVQLAIGEYQQEIIDGYKFNLTFLGAVEGTETEGSASSGSTDSSTEPFYSVVAQAEAAGQPLIESSIAKQKKEAALIAKYSNPAVEFD